VAASSFLEEKIGEEYFKNQNTNTRGSHPWFYEFWAFIGILNIVKVILDILILTI
jgi:hypothetical protein